MLLINRAFEIVTPESAEHGDAEARGMLASNEQVTFRELVSMLREGGEVSSYPATGDVREWVTQDQGETRAWFERGEREYRSIHYSRDNAARKARYWRLAFVAAGLIKECGQ
jgi:hypothetical protein